MRFISGAQNAKVLARLSLLMRKAGVSISAVMAFMALAVPARADLVLNFNDIALGASPDGAAPWLTADFRTVKPGQVSLTLTSHFQSPSEFLSEVFFNTSQSSLPGAL